MISTEVKLQFVRIVEALKKEGWLIYYFSDAELEGLDVKDFDEKMCDFSYKLLCNGKVKE